MPNKTKDGDESLDIFSVVGLPKQSQSEVSSPSAADQKTKRTAKIEKTGVNPPQTSEALSERFLRDSAVALRYGVCRQTVWRWAERGKLPSPVKLSEGVTRWRLSDLLAFERSIPNKARAEAREARGKKASSERESK